MSLVGDALRKARREAAERESQRRGILYSARIADQPTRSNLGLGLALGALIAVVATVAGGLAVWWIFVRGTPQQPGAITATPAAEVGHAASAPPPELDSDDSDQRQPPRSGATTAGSGSGQRRRPTAESGPDVVSVPEPPAREATPGTTTPPDTAVSPGEADRSPHDSGAAAHGPEPGFAGVENGEEVFILEADLGGGVILSLDFLVYRPEDPFAEINGVEVHLGGTIEGFRVKTIERDRVRLTDGRRTIVLRAP